MNCNDFKDFIIVNIYRKLTSSEKEDFDLHRRECPNCAQLYKTTENYHGILEENNEVPLPDWDESWTVISEGAFKKKRFTLSLFPAMRYAVVSAAVLTVFVVGMFTGKHFLYPSDPKVVRSHMSPIQNYTESLEPVLINFSNRSDEQRTEEYSEIEVQILTEMLAQTRLLKYLAAQRNDDFQTKLLEDLEFVLVDMTNLRPGDQDSAEQLIRLIKEKELKFRLKRFAEENPFI
jgi:hypothetical protein